MKSWGLVVFLAWLPMSCKGEFSDWVDTAGFVYLGTTVMTDTDTLTTKELHFDTGRLIGRKVIVEGEVLAWGEHSTHIVVKDGYGRLLVVTNKIPDLRHDIGKDKPERIRVLGTVERGKKGLPYLLATSIVAGSGGKASL